jgi:hypothetical protein
MRRIYGGVGVGWLSLPHTLCVTKTTVRYSLVCSAVCVRCGLWVGLSEVLLVRAVPAND